MYRDVQEVAGLMFVLHVAAEQVHVNWETIPPRAKGLGLR